MVKCPECGTKINYLKLKQEVTISGKLNSRGKITNYHIDHYEALWYCCPECDEELFSDGDALGFLNGKYSQAILD